MDGFHGIENKHGVYRGEDYVKKFFKFVREHAIKKMTFGKKKLIPLSNKWKKNICCICKKFKQIYTNDKNYRKVKDHYHYTGKYIGSGHSICNLKYSIIK